MGTYLSSLRIFFIITTRVAAIAHAFMWRQTEGIMAIHTFAGIGITRFLPHLDFTDSSLSRALISAQLIHAQLVSHCAVKG